MKKEIDEANSGPAPDSGTTAPLLKLRVIYSDMQPVEVRTSHTVAALLLGEGSHAEHLMFECGVQKQLGKIALWGLWFIGAMLGGLAVAQTLPLSFVWASVLMLPLPFITICLLSIDLIKEVVVGLDLYIIYILQIAFFVDGIYYCNADKRTVFWVCYLPTMFASGLVDAYPARYRAFFAKLFFTASLAILIIWNCLMAFKWDAFGGTDELVNISFTLHHLSDQATLGVFYCRHLYLSIFRDEYFVLIKSDVLTRYQECECYTETSAEGKETATVIMNEARRSSEVIMHESRSVKSIV